MAEERKDVEEGLLWTNVGVPEECAESIQRIAASQGGSPRARAAQMLATALAANDGDDVEVIARTKVGDSVLRGFEDLAVAAITGDLALGEVAAGAEWLDPVENGDGTVTAGVRLVVTGSAWAGYLETELRWEV